MEHSNKQIKKHLIFFTVILVAALSIITVTIINTSHFSFKGVWQNVGETSYGHICPGEYLYVEEETCDLCGDKYNTYQLVKIDKNDYLLIISNFSQYTGDVVFEIRVIDKNHIIIKHSWCEIQMERVNDNNIEKNSPKSGFCI